MSISTVATIIFFAAYGVNVFWRVPFFTLVAGIAAIVAAIAIGAKK